MPVSLQYEIDHKEISYNLTRQEMNFQITTFSNGKRLSFVAAETATSSHTNPSWNTLQNKSQGVTLKRSHVDNKCDEFLSFKTPRLMKTWIKEHIHLNPKQWNKYTSI